MLMLLCFNIAYYRSNRQVSYAIKKCLVGAFTYTLGNFEKPCYINQKRFSKSGTKTSIFLSLDYVCWTDTLAVTQYISNGHTLRTYTLNQENRNIQMRVLVKIVRKQDCCSENNWQLVRCIVTFMGIRVFYSKIVIANNAHKVATRLPFFLEITKISRLSS